MKQYDAAKKELSCGTWWPAPSTRRSRPGGAPRHGGAFLDMPPSSAAEISRKLPSMCDQFEVLAGVDITREPMEVGPTIHYTMGGVSVDAETAATTFPASTPPVRSLPVCMVPTVWAGTPWATSSSSAGALGAAAAEYAERHAARPRLRAGDQVEEEVKLLPLSGDPRGGPPRTRSAAPGPAGGHAGRGRRSGRSEQSLQEPSRSPPTAQRSGRMRVSRRPRATTPASDLPGRHFMLTLSEAIVRCALERRESRGAPSGARLPGEGRGARRGELRGAQGRRRHAGGEPPGGAAARRGPAAAAMSRFFDAKNLPRRYAERLAGAPATEGH